MSVHDPDTAADAQASPQSITWFLEEITELARAVEPAVAQLLDRDGPSEPAKPWTRGRRQGLELCLSMLCYLRQEVARGDVEQRLDSAIAHIVRELAAVDGRGGSTIN